MKKVIISGLVLLLTMPAAYAAQGSIATTGYASQLPPIYTPPEQQNGQIWGTTEVVRCPDGYGLVFEPSAAGNAPNSPICKPYKPLTGGNQ